MTMTLTLPAPPRAEDHLRLVSWVVGRLRKSHEAARYASRDDLMQSGYLGLCKAVRLYDPANGTAFSTYAAKAIWSQAIKSLERDGVIRVSHHVRKKAASCPKAAAKLKQATRLTPLYRTALEVSDHRRYDTFSVEPIDHREPPEPACPHEWPEAEKALATLHPRHRRVLRLFFWEGMPQREVAVVMGISEEWARGLKLQALAKLRARLGVKEVG
jgi:RNA polymerase sigma factor (sigma-70 family)